MTLQNAAAKTLQNSELLEASQTFFEPAEQNI